MSPSGKGVGPRLKQSSSVAEMVAKARTIN